MRKLLLLATAVPLAFAPPALADENTERQSVCRAPDVDIQYDVQTFGVDVTLPASGCASREHRIFTLSATITRYDSDDSREVTDGYSECGPFRSAADFEDGEAPSQYACNLAVALDHPEQEEGVRYDVDVTYPGATAERTMRRFTFCTSDGETAVCEQ